MLGSSPIEGVKGVLIGYHGNSNTNGNYAGSPSQPLRKKRMITVRDTSNGFPSHFSCSPPATSPLSSMTPVFSAAAATSTTNTLSALSLSLSSHTTTNNHVPNLTMTSASSSSSSSSSSASSTPCSSPSPSPSPELFDVQSCLYLRDANRYLASTGRRRALPNVMDIQGLDLSSR